MTSSTLARILLAAPLVLAVSGCVIATNTSDHAKVRYEIVQNYPDIWMKVADGIKINSDHLATAPEEFNSSSIKCQNVYGIFNKGMSEISLAPSDSLIFQVKIRNDTQHVARLSSSEITLIDPQGNQYSALNKDRLKLHFLAEHACQDTPQLTLEYADLKIVDSDFKILPGRANRGYVVFKPRNVKMPGEWSMSFYDVVLDSIKPLENAGPETLTYKFTMNKYADVFTKVGWGGATFTKTTLDLTAGGTPEEALEKVQAARALAEAEAAKAAAEMEAAEKAAAEAKVAAAEATDARAAAETAAAEAKEAAAKKAAAKIAAEKVASEKAAALKAAVEAATAAAEAASKKVDALKAAAETEARTSKAAAQWKK